MSGIDEAEEPAQAAERLDELADTAELMGDIHTAERLRERSHAARIQAMKSME